MDEQAGRVDSDGSPVATALSPRHFDSIDELVVVFDAVGALTSWNRSLTAVTGYTDEALSSLPTERLFVDADTVREQVATAAETGQATFDAEVRTSDGDRLVYEFTATVHTVAGEVATDSDDNDDDNDGVVCIGRDVTETRRRERELTRYEVVLESLPDAVYAIEPDGTISYVNEKYATMKGVPRVDLLGTDIDDWVVDETVDEADELRSELATGARDVATIEYEFVTSDGTRFPAELRFGAVGERDSELGRVGMIRDVTERAARERQLQRQNARLDEFASIVSHDLRNPLNIAQGRLELGRTAHDNEHLAAVETAHTRMRALIDDLLALARHGQADTEVTTVSLPTVAERSWHPVERSGATLVVETDATIRADESQLQRLLANLFRNGVEHSSTSSRSGADDSVEHGSTSNRTAEQSGDSVEHSSTGSRPEADDSVEHGIDEVTVTVGDLDDGFFVADDGPGIPPDVRERVFEMGYSTNSEGTGFGLSIVREIADAHGWSVRVADSDDGARFEIRGVSVV